MASSASVNYAKRFMSSGRGGGRWATERMVQALRAGRRMSPAELRTCDTLRKDEWIHLDETVLEEATIRLQVVGDLIDAGLTIPVPNAMGKTQYQWETSSDMEEAIVSLSGIERSDNDRIDFGLASVPLPITHKDFDLELRHLEASRERGEALDTGQVRRSTRKVAEKQEEMLISGGPAFGGFSIYGVTNHPDRITSSFGTNGNWSQVAKTGTNMLDDLLTATQDLDDNNYPGPYWALLPSAYRTIVSRDFKTETDKSILARLGEIDGLQKVIFAKKLPADNIVVFQATTDVVAMLTGEPIQTIQWDMAGGFAIAFKVFMIQIPLVRSDSAGQSGVFHMS